MFILGLLDKSEYVAGIWLYSCLLAWIVILTLYAVVYRIRYKEAPNKGTMIMLGLYLLFYIYVGFPINLLVSVVILIIPFLIHYAVKGEFVRLVKDYLQIYLPLLIAVLAIFVPIFS